MKKSEAIDIIIECWNTYGEIFRSDLTSIENVEVSDSVWDAFVQAKSEEDHGTQA